MVEPVTPGERASFARKVMVVVTLLVGLSGGLVAIQADATLVQAAVITVICLPVGAVIAWYVVPTTSRADAQRAARESDGPLADGSGNDENDRPPRR